VIVKAIEHTGIELSGWLKPVNSRQAKAPAPARDGPLRGQRIAILGAARDGELATWLAAAGGRVVASAGVTSTMLVVSHDQPFGRYAHAAPAYRRALELQLEGHSIEIIAEEDLRQRIDRAQASAHA
jgi:DNA polymerase-3 subunit epsilon